MKNKRYYSIFPEGELIFLRILMISLFVILIALLVRL